MMYETGCTLSIQFVYGTVTGGRTVFFSEDTRVVQKKNAGKKSPGVKLTALCIIAVNVLYYRDREVAKKTQRPNALR